MKWAPNNVKEIAAPSKTPSITASLYHHSLFLSLPRSVHLVSCPGTLLGYELSVAGMAWAKTQARSSLCASNETDCSNNISKAGESEATMQTLSNYCCGPVIALPKSCFNIMKCWTAHAYREKRPKNNKKHWGFFSVERVLYHGAWVRVVGPEKVMMGIKTDLMSTQKHKCLVAWGELLGHGILHWLLKKGEQAIILFALKWNIASNTEFTHSPIISDS